MRVQGYWLGPELVWIALLAVAQALPRLNRPPSDAGNRWMMRLGWAWVTLGVLLPFGLWPFVAYGKGWLLLRIALADAVGVLWSSFLFCGAIDYKDSRNSGLLALWTLYLMAGAATLLAGLIAGAVVAFAF